MLTWNFRAGNLPSFFGSNSGATNGHFSGIQANSGASPVGPADQNVDLEREALRAQHYSPRTEEACLAWIRRLFCSTTSVTLPKWANRRSTVSAASGGITWMNLSERPPFSKGALERHARIGTGAMTGYALGHQDARTTMIYTHGLNHAA